MDFLPIYGARNKSNVDRYHEQILAGIMANWHTQSSRGPCFTPVFPLFVEQYEHVRPVCLCVFVHAYVDGACVRARVPGSTEQDVELWAGQVWGHTPEQRVAASNLRRYFFGLRLAIAQADARPAMPVSFRYDST